MKKAEIMNNITRNFGKFGLKMKKHSPEILVVVGVVGTVASTVAACKATLKATDILDEAKENIAKIHECAALCSEKEELKEKYQTEEVKKDLATVYVQTGVKLAKVYAPAIILGTFSIGCIVKSHGILNKRNAALAAAYTTADKGFKEYRQRVVERFGKDMDRELRYNIKAKEIEETIVDEKGKEKTVTKTVEVVDSNKYSEFARFFDASSTCWEDDAELNLMFLKAQQKYANDLLVSRGYLFVNEVYDILDIPITIAGQVVGWVYDKTKSSDEQVGDGYVDFGIYESQRFVNGLEPVILLDFNVDGNILDLI